MASKDKATIMVVDDQLDIRILSKRILENAGYAVIVAEDGVKALELLENESIDLIVADIAMPNLNGYQLFERVSKNPDWVHLPFILLSARDLDSDIRYGKSLGVDDYITKPFDPPDLLSSVRGRLVRAEQLSSTMNTSNAVGTTKDINSQFANSGMDKQIKTLTIDPHKHLVWFMGNEIKLSSREFILLLVLYDNHQRVVPVEELVHFTHGLNVDRNQASSLLRSLIRSLRRKLGFQTGENGCIRNVRGIGYQYTDIGDPLMCGCQPKPSSSGKHEATNPSTPLKK